jgi:hypothetical protein
VTEQLGWTIAVVVGILAVVAWASVVTMHLASIEKELKGLREDFGRAMGVTSREGYHLVAIKDQVHDITKNVESIAQIQTERLASGRDN